MVEIPAARLVHYQKSLASAQQEKKECHDEIDRLTSVVEELQEENDVLMNDVHGLFQESESLKKDLEEQRALRTCVSKQFKQVQIERDTLFENVEQLQQQLNEQKQQQRKKTASSRNLILHEEYGEYDVDTVEQIKLSTKIQLRKSHEEKRQLVDILVSVQKELDDLREAQATTRPRSNSSLHTADFQIPDGILRSTSVTDDQVELVWECDSSIAKNNTATATRMLFGTSSFRKPSMHSHSGSFRHRRQARAQRMAAGDLQKHAAGEDHTVSTPYTAQSDDQTSSEDDRYLCGGKSLASSGQKTSILERFRLRQQPQGVLEVLEKASNNASSTLEPTAEEDIFAKVVSDDDAEQSGDGDDDDSKSSVVSVPLDEGTILEHEDQRDNNNHAVVAANTADPLDDDGSMLRSALTAAASMALEGERQRQGASVGLVGLGGEVVKGLVPGNVRRSRWGSKMFGDPCTPRPKRRISKLNGMPRLQPQPVPTPLE
jgi:hypothetical protein